MHKIMLAGAAVALLAAAPAFSQTTQSERAAAAPNAGTSGKVGVTTDGVVPNPPAVNGSGSVTSDSTGASTTGAAKARQTLDQRGVPKRGDTTETTTGAKAGATVGGGSTGATTGAGASGSAGAH
jgi:hypothetical protein